MTERGYVLLVGVVLGLFGVASLVPGLAHPVPIDAPALLVSDAYGYVLGAFPMNIVSTVLYLTMGTLGVAAWHGLVPAVSYARSLAVAFAFLTVMGLSYPSSIAFGLAPLFGADVGLHAAIAASATVYGFVSEAVPTTQA
jgi:hypothetical protein